MPGNVQFSEVSSGQKIGARPITHDEVKGCVEFGYESGYEPVVGIEGAAETKVGI